MLELLRHLLIILSCEDFYKKRLKLQNHSQLLPIKQTIRTLTKWSEEAIEEAVEIKDEFREVEKLVNEETSEIAETLGIFKFRRSNEEQLKEGAPETFEVPLVFDQSNFFA